jgi:hypothetical protein
VALEHRHVPGPTASAVMQPIFIGVVLRLLSRVI